MRHAIYWFSGTGNCLAAAKGLRETLGDADLHPIAAGHESLAAPCDHLILVFPVYAGGLPAPVTRFIGSLPPGAVQRATVVVTHGGMPGLSARTAAVLLADRGVNVVNTYTCRMVDNYPPLGGPPKPATCRKREAAAAARIAGLGRRIAADAAAGATSRRSPAPLRWLCRKLNAFSRKAMSGCDRGFRVTEACTGCRICERVCPVGDIALSDGRPVWQGRCVACFACYHACPSAAILYGRRQQASRQYRHPAVAVAELLDRRAGEASGRSG